MRCYRKGRETAPERAVAAWLKDHGIAFKSQAEFKIGFVDFHVPSCSIVIEVDGDYWHSSQVQKKRDKSRDAYLTKIGLRVIRVRESDIKADIDAAMKATGL